MQVFVSGELEEGGGKYLRGGTLKEHMDPNT